MRAVRLVLDVSALDAYAQMDRGMAVAEAITMLAEDDMVTAIPAVALASAFASAAKPDERTRLERLVVAQTCLVLALRPQDSLNVGVLRGEYGLRLGDAQAVQETLNHEASQLATFEHEQYAGVRWLPADRILRLDLDWDDEPPPLA